MLRTFELKNYKNFKEWIKIDFSNIGGYKYNEDCLTNQLISKMIIYGRNATGKTNLGKAIFDIQNNLYSHVFFRRSEGVYLNADTHSEFAKYIYTFQFGVDEIIYKYKKNSEMKLYDEELILNGKETFYYNFETKESSFDNLKYLDADTINIERFTKAMNSSDDDDNNQTISFLRWMINNSALAVDSVLLKLDEFIKSMSMISLNSSISRGPRRMNESFYDSLADTDALKDFEDFLNIMGIECKLVIKELPEGEHQLYFKHNKLVTFFENASSGTLALTELYRRFAMRKTPSIMYLDEFDAYYHYEMSEKVIEYFKKKYPRCQVILTTHNTNLMNNRIMRPDCLFILSQKGNLTSLNNATNRELREGHNLEKMYISGEFDRYE